MDHPPPPTPAFGFNFFNRNAGNFHRRAAPSGSMRVTDDDVVYVVPRQRIPASKSKLPDREIRCVFDRCLLASCVTTIADGGRGGGGGEGRGRERQLKNQKSGNAAEIRDSRMELEARLDSFSRNEGFALSLSSSRKRIRSVLAI